MELEPKHLAPYFAHELKCMVEYEVNDNQIVNLLAMSNGMISVSKKSFPYSENLQLCDIKPILRPLSDLKRSTCLNEFYIMFGGGYTSFTNYRKDNLDNILYSSYETLPYEIVNLLFRLHYDVFGLIPKGLAININDLAEATNGKLKLKNVEL
jgi:hypothetical protein